ncbi:hypothetical protein [Myceligenerans salitolerans]|uniref:Uncharacterized protein n=1 Tax=Myceligenerans salitolerans TaxID=1230528 RepID=A0ABS3IEA0_9MICO|nr:hypothetical protein [Myceligenerans salitolerans]MBO0611310.1 hypothetical protein [Myceligenerans salitolerans]
MKRERATASLAGLSCDSEFWKEPFMYGNSLIDYILWALREIVATIGL